MSMEKYDPSLSHFDIDVKRGSQAELFVGDIIRMLADGSGSIEVKRDAWYPLRGRFYVERECRGRDGRWRPSGINVTKAKYWVFVWGAHEMLTLSPTSSLKRAVEIAGERPGNNDAKCDYGENPTRGTYVYDRDLREARDKSLDEH